MSQLNSKAAIIAALKQLRFVPEKSADGTEIDKSQVTFPSQAAGQEFLDTIPPIAQKELGLRIEADMSSGTSAIVINHMAHRRLMAIDFASYVGATQSQPSGAVQI